MCGRRGADERRRECESETEVKTEKMCMDRFFLKHRFLNQCVKDKCSFLCIV